MKLIVNVAQAYIENLPSTGSHRTARETLNRIAKIFSDGEKDMTTFDWGSLRYADTMSFRSYLIQHYQPASINKQLSILRGVLKIAWRLGQMTADEYQHAIDIKNVHRTNTVPGRMLEEDEIKALFRTCDEPSLLNIRDKALLSVMLNTGIRRSELIMVDMGDFDPDAGIIMIRHGKQHQIRETYLPASAVKAVSTWIEMAAKQIKISETMPLFLPLKKNGKLTVRRMTSQAFYLIIRQRSIDAGIDEISPHDFRRTLISTLLEKGADISIVSTLVGHSKVERTAAYDRRGIVQRRKVAALVDFNGD